MFANEISVIANVIPRASASWEISLEYDGNPPVAKPTTRPLETIVGKLRQGRNTLAARRGRVEKLADLHARCRGCDRPRGLPSVGPNSFPITNDFRTETFYSALGGVLHNHSCHFPYARTPKASPPPSPQCSPSSSSLSSFNSLSSPSSPV